MNDMNNLQSKNLFHRAAAALIAVTVPLFVLARVLWTGEEPVNVSSRFPAAFSCAVSMSMCGGDEHERRT